MDVYLSGFTAPQIVTRSPFSAMDSYIVLFPTRNCWGIKWAAYHIVFRERPSISLLSSHRTIFLTPPSLCIHAPRRAVSVCPGGPHRRTILVGLCPRYSIAAPTRVCRPLVDYQRGRNAEPPEQSIYLYHCSIRSQSLRFLELGIPEHWGNGIPV